MTYAEYARNLWRLAPTAPSGEWQVVMYFYAAVHATNAVLYGGSTGAPTTHTAHEARLVAHATLSTFEVEYNALKDLSLDARYRPAGHPMAPRDIAHARRLAEVLLAACGLP